MFCFSWIWTRTAFSSTFRHKSTTSIPGFSRSWSFYVSNCAVPTGTLSTQSHCIGTVSRRICTVSTPRLSSSAVSIPVIR